MEWKILQLVFYFLATISHTVLADQMGLMVFPWSLWRLESYQLRMWPFFVCPLADSMWPRYGGSQGSWFSSRRGSCSQVCKS